MTDPSGSDDTLEAARACAAELAAAQERVDQLLDRRRALAKSLLRDYTQNQVAEAFGISRQGLVNALKRASSK